MALDGSELTSLGVTGAVAQPFGPFLFELIAANPVLFGGSATARPTLGGTATVRNTLGGSVTVKPE